MAVKKPDGLTPLLSDSNEDRPKQSRQCVDTLLKVVLGISVVAGILWTSYKLSTYYHPSPKCQVVSFTVIEQFRHETISGERVDDTNTNSDKAMCDIADDNHRFDCHPGPGASQVVCEERGCCWRQAKGGGRSYFNSTVNRPLDVPYCYFPSNYPSYEVQDVQETDYGYSIDLYSSRNSTMWPGNLQRLHLDVFMETETRLHFKITDATAARYEVPIDTPTITKKVASTDYSVAIKKEPFGIVIKRTKTGSIVFDSTLAPLLYANQYLQLSTVVPSGYLYGLGEHRSALYHNASTWQQVALWARDQPPGVNENLYGVHPFFMSLEKDGNAYGVFFLNSNAMDIDIQPYPAVTYRTVGGVLDFYVLLGPTPSAVIQQYTAVVGRPTLPPYWALGFHLCRWGYGGTAGLRGVIQRMRNAMFPYDVQWMDIDYMRKHLDWTYDEENYTGLPDVIQDLHDHGQHFVIIVDPGISSSQQPGQYPPYDDGLKQDVFVKDYKGNPIEGIVWPGRTVFPDFTNPQTEDWWYGAAKDFHSKIAFDGLWTDMNEPSNFVRGSTHGCSKSSLDNPPYTPGILGGELAVKTLCPSARQHLGSHYDLHSLYGHSEARASHRALEKLLGKRSLVITRSSYPGTGQYAGHWTGDNRANWDDLYYSIPTMLSFQLFAVPLVGADTCGFSGDTTEELCTRWMQLAAFYPFMRNHNMIHAKDQDPASFSETAQGRMRAALVTRYTLLPYLYTLFYISHSQGGAVVNALSFIYPQDSVTHTIDHQFMWGDGLLISPVLLQGQTSVTAYFPNDTWYDLPTGELVVSTGQWVTLHAPLDVINVHVRGGSIIPLQHPRTETTTTNARKNPFQFLVGLDIRGEAEGLFYWDDGETINATENGLYHLQKLQVVSGRLTASVEHAGYTPPSALTVDSVTVLGVPSQPKSVSVNSAPTHFTWDPSTKVMVVPKLSINLLQSWNVTWNL